MVCAVTDIRVIGGNMDRPHQRQGDDYIIPIKRGRQNLPAPLIKYFIKVFLQYARQHPELKFRVTAIACGSGAYKPHQIGPFFDYHTQNVYLPCEFQA